MPVMSEGKIGAVHECILSYQQRHGKSPSYREIMHRCGLHTIGQVQRCIRALKERGEIESESGGRIAMDSRLYGAVINVPIIGAVRCGKPSLAIEDYEGTFALPKELAGPGEFFILTAEGDSMDGAHIFEGDYLLIRRQETAGSGDIVVAVKESDYGCEETDATLKRFKYKNGNPVLHAENEKYEDMDAREFRIIGKLKCVIRDMETYCP